MRSFDLFFQLEFFKGLEDAARQHALIDVRLAQVIKGPCLDDFGGNDLIAVAGNRNHRGIQCFLGHPLQQIEPRTVRKKVVCKNKIEFVI